MINFLKVFGAAEPESYKIAGKISYDIFNIYFLHSQ